MKKISLVVMALCASGAHAELAYVAPLNGESIGNTVSLTSKAVFYLNRKCKLAVVNAEHMRYYVYFREGGDNEVGCWGKTIDGTVFNVVRRGISMNVDEEVLYKVDVKTDGTGVVVERPAFFNRR